MIRQKKIITILISIFLIIAMSTTAFAAAWKDFTLTLPKTSGNVWGGTISKSTEDKDYFTITISSISDGFSTVRAWTESFWGVNYSNSNYQIDIVEGKNINYDKKTPDEGDMVKLNLDNPIKTTIKPTVKGRWTPN